MKRPKTEKDLKTIVGEISEHDLLISLFESVGCVYKKPNDVEKYFQKEGGGTNNKIGCQSRRCRRDLDKLVKKGIVGRIEEEEVWDFKTAQAAITEAAAGRA